MNKHYFLLLALLFSLSSCKQDGGKVLDFEHHYYCPDLIEYLKSRNEFPYYRSEDGLWMCRDLCLKFEVPAVFNHSKAAEGKTFMEVMTNLDTIRIEEMDMAGVTTAFISTTSGIEELPMEESVKYARATNDAIAAAVKRHPGRMEGTICLPTPYVEESVKELERAVNELGLKHWHTHSNYRGHYLYETEYEPILAKCEELGVPFYLHPSYPCDPYLSDYGIGFGGAAFGSGVDVMKTAILLIMNGVFDRHPKLIMILGHMGEFFPYSLGRMDNRMNATKDYDPRLKKEHDFEYYFKNKNIFFTTSGVSDPLVVLFAIQKIGIDNILFGSDFPYENFKESVDFIKNLPISNEDKDKIFYKNAEKYIINN